MVSCTDPNAETSAGWFSSATNLNPCTGTVEPSAQTELRIRVLAKTAKAVSAKRAFAQSPTLLARSSVLTLDRVRSEAATQTVVPYSIPATIASKSAAPDRLQTSFLKGGVAGRAMDGNNNYG